MLSSLVVLSALPLLSLAGPLRRQTNSTTNGTVSIIGATASYTPFPEVSNTGQDASDFPSTDAFLKPGPTPSNVEPGFIQTAPTGFYPSVTNAYPLATPSVVDSTNDNFNALDYFGNLSPYHSGPQQLNTTPIAPQGCQIEQVHILHRHGARYPSGSGGPSTFAIRLYNATAVNHTTVTGSGPLEFLNGWTYKLGAEILTPPGRQELYDSGVFHRMAYGYLLDKFTSVPVFRTTSEDRMVKSATNWLGGFFGFPYDTDAQLSVIAEASGFNNTLAPYDTCNNSNTETIGYYADANIAHFIPIYLANATTRIQQYITGINLTSTDIYGMQNLCAYETVALGYSAFCDLFTEDEWKGFEYTLDLDFDEGGGFASPVGKSQGAGYVQELLARMTSTPISNYTGAINQTLDGSNITFPVIQPLYADFTHDIVIANVIAALNLTQYAAFLPNDQIPQNQEWITSNLVPFGARLVTQVLTCSSTTTSNTTTNSTGKYVRLVLNDAVQNMTGITGCTDSSNGMCSFDAFVTAQQEMIAQANFGVACFANYTIPPGYNVTNGSPPPFNTTA